MARHIHVTRQDRGKEPVRVGREMWPYWSQRDARTLIVDNAALLCRNGYKVSDLYVSDAVELITVEKDGQTTTFRAYKCEERHA